MNAPKKPKKNKKTKKIKNPGFINWMMIIKKLASPRVQEWKSGDTIWTSKCKEKNNGDIVIKISVTYSDGTKINTMKIKQCLESSKATVYILDANMELRVNLCDVIMSKNNLIEKINKKQFDHYGSTVELFRDVLQ